MSKQDKLEKVSEGLYRLGEALEQVSQVSNCEDIVEALTDRIFILAFAKEELEKQVYEENVRELGALKREYWRAVL